MSVLVQGCEKSRFDVVQFDWLGSVIFGALVRYYFGAGCA
jgi:hypothetical protein